MFLTFLQFLKINGSECLHASLTMQFVSISHETSLGDSNRCSRTRIANANRHATLDKGLQHVLQLLR